MEQKEEQKAGNGMSATESSWIASSIVRCRRALLAVSCTADRLALLRSLVRLNGGRVDLADLPISLSAEDYLQFARFGLARTNSDRSVRIVDEDDPPGLSGLTASMILDAQPRRIFETASPDAVLLRLTQHARYRTIAQKAAVRALLTQPHGSGLMVSMPTGSGKSLLFQIAANFGREAEPGACSIVITPTVALALDHERTLSRMSGLEGSRALTGDTPFIEAEATINGFRRGDVPVLLLSPEKALNPALSAHLVEAATPSSVEYGLDARLTHIFVDEAHIVETWGRSFRPDFQRLPALLARLRTVNPALRAVLLSATLPDTSRSILRESWQLDGEWLEVDARLPRYEHDVVIGHFPSDLQRAAALDHVIDRAPRPLILYTTEIASAKAIHDRLGIERGFRRVALFTGDTGTRDRRRIVEDWASDAFDIVVATSAFGMGIDKADVRTVVHACLPEGPARWYQEIGRASRDNGQGLAVCLFIDGPKPNDVSQAYSLATAGWLTRDLAEQRWSAMVKAAGGRTFVGERQQMTIDLDAFREGIRPKAGDWNRGWNMTLLTLMQRAGVLRVETIATDGDQPEFSWTIEILDHRALDGVNDDLWQQINEFRARELAEVRADLDAFVDLMCRPERNCVTRTTFELIEPQSFAPPCGRCPSCREAGIAPPLLLHASGLEKIWTARHPARGALPHDTLIVVPADPHFGTGLPELVAVLTGAGIDQIVVPFGLAERVAQLMVASPTRLGLVLDEREWTGGNRLADLATAVLLPDSAIGAEAYLDRLQLLRSEHEAPLLVVARPDLVVRGRRLDQILSRYAPYSQDMLALQVSASAGQA